MQFEHRGKIIELSLVGIHYPDSPPKRAEKARAVWKTTIDGQEYCGTDTGNREEVLDKWKKFIDWCIDDPDMTQIF